MVSVRISCQRHPAVGVLVMDFVWITFLLIFLFYLRDCYWVMHLTNIFSGFCYSTFFCSLIKLSGVIKIFSFFDIIVFIINSFRLTIVSNPLSNFIQILAWFIFLFIWRLIHSSSYYFHDVNRCGLIRSVNTVIPFFAKYAHP